MDLDPKTLNKSSTLSRHGIPVSDPDSTQLVLSTDKALILIQHEWLLPIHQKIMNTEADASIMFRSPNISFRNIDLESCPLTGPSARDQLIPGNRVDISTLTENVDKVLPGKYFLCRTLAPSYKSYSIEAIVEDPIGQQGIHVSLYNYSSLNKCSYDVLLDELPVAQILAIKNPLFKSKQNGGFFLKCDNPKDVFVISEPMSQELFPGVMWEGEIPEKWQKFIQCTPKTLTEWKNRGNEEFLLQKYEKAIRSYTEGLKLNDGTGTDTASSSVMCAILSNRAVVYLKLDCFQSALEDVEKLLEIDPAHFKGLYLKGKALLGLQRFQEAVQLLEQLSNVGNVSSDNKKLLMELMESALKCLRQQTTGEYNILKLYKAGYIRHKDCADFMGPVKIQKIIRGRCGRGLVATQDIQPGQLISATKAFEIIFLPNPKATFSVSLYDQFLNPTTSSHREKLFQKIVRKLTLEPNLCRTFYQLYAGPDFQMFDVDKDKDPLVVDLKRIDAIIRYNTLEGNTPFVTSGCTGSPQKSIGIWILPSLINHCCWDVNAIWMTFGDMLFVRALKEIPIGAEILISYVDPTQLYKEREKLFNLHGFVCECRLCQIDRDESKEGQKRMELLKKIQENRQAHNIGVVYQWEMEVMMDELWDLDKDGQKLNLKLNPSLIDPLLDSGHFHFRLSQYKKCVKLFTKRYALATDSSMKQMAVDSCFRLINVHLEDGNVEEAKGWEETVKRELMTLYGTLELAKLMMDKGTFYFMRKYNILFK